MHVSSKDLSSAMFLTFGHHSTTSIGQLHANCRFQIPQMFHLVGACTTNWHVSDARWPNGQRVGLSRMDRVRALRLLHCRSPPRSINGYRRTVRASRQNAGRRVQQYSQSLHATETGIRSVKRCQSSRLPPSFSQSICPNNSPALRFGNYAQLG